MFNSCNTIKRDRAWFSKVDPLLNEFWKDVTYFRKNEGLEKVVVFQDKKRKKSDEMHTINKKKKKEYNTRFLLQKESKEYLSHDISEWVSATETRNYILDDPLLDYFNLYGKMNSITVDSKVNELDFANFIRNKGITFEDKIINYIYANHNKNFRKIAESNEEYSTVRAKQTFDAMKEGIPIIYHGVLHDNEEKMYGIPDIIIRSDYINNLFEVPVLSGEDKYISAPLISEKYHYLIIDIKFAGLNLNHEGKYLLNNNEYPAYKSQIYVYNYILGKLQGFMPDCAYILGRRVFYKKEK